MVQKLNIPEKQDENFMNDVENFSNANANFMLINDDKMYLSLMTKGKVPNMKIVFTPTNKQLYQFLVYIEYDFPNNNYRNF